MLRKVRLAALLFALLSASCGDSLLWDSSCDSEMQDVRSDFGEPEDIDTYTSGSYQTVDWWYWRQNIAFRFTYYTQCEVSSWTLSSYR
jgi:hypothetical protein